MFLLVSGGVIVALATLGVFGFQKFHRQTPVHDEKKAALTIVSIPTIVSNLDTGDGRARYVKITARVQTQGAPDAAKMALLMPQIQDAFQTCLHGMRPDEMEGVGIYRLRETMLVQIENILAPLPVRDLFFVEVLVQ
ncbi:flagellar FliL protein [Neokomagataea thailandica NBRC 106555]|nr:flagellar FliL protein [Neokomagataea thailandica NBRC 106555]